MLNYILKMFCQGSKVRETKPYDSVTRQPLGFRPTPTFIIQYPKFCVLLVLSLKLRPEAEKSGKHLKSCPIERCSRKVRNGREEDGNPVLILEKLSSETNNKSSVPYVNRLLSTYNNYYDSYGPICRHPPQSEN